MITKLFICLWCLTITVHVPNELKTIRDAYRTIDTDQATIDNFHNLTLETMPTSKPVYLGYHGAALALKASIAGSIKDKLTFFTKGKNLIEKAIEQDPNNIELRMIRLSIQSNVPKIVGYRGSIEEDKAYIKNNLSKVTDAGLAKLLTGFIENSGVFLH
ncbi:hypothetical protein ACE939_04935 [Aquimarina sp. W85]|uniref:hypothetical protein n=1 Tax=Aquimarina rhodophyticola TaxID=3342246 RepID=UPI00366AC421